MVSLDRRCSHGDSFEVMEKRKIATWDGCAEKTLCTSLRKLKTMELDMSALDALKWLVISKD